MVSNEIKIPPQSLLENDISKIFYWWILNMLKVLDVTLDYRKDVRELSDRVLDQLRRSKRTILLHSIQWISITTACFLLIYGIGTLALYNISLPSTGPARSDLQADYGEWTILAIPRIESEIIEEIKRDKPQNPEVFMNPDAVNPDEDPFIIIQDQQGNGDPPILDVPIPTTVASEPTSTRSPVQSPTPTPIETESPTPTPILILTIKPTNTPNPTQRPTNTPLPPNPTSPPPPTDPFLVTICHKPGDRNEKTIRVPLADLANHFAHGDYIGECANP